MDLDTYEYLVRRSLEHGVPHEIVAEVFELSPDVAKALQNEVRVTEFGTSDQAEFLDYLQWLTLKRAAHTIEHGSPAEASRIATAVLGRQIAAAGKKPSDALTEERRKLMDLMGSMRDAPPVLVEAGRFVVGNANPERGDEEDEDE